MFIYKPDIRFNMLLTPVAIKPNFKKILLDQFLYYVKILERQ